MEEVLVGEKRRYHIENKVDSNQFGNVYSAFARRKSGKRIKRRYYAVVECNTTVDADISLNTAIQQSLMTSPVEMRVEEDLLRDGRRFVVFAKGKEPSQRSNVGNALLNHGYLMLLLAATILILMVIKYFQ